jgi:hypothetical protein
MGVGGGVGEEEEEGGGGCVRAQERGLRAGRDATTHVNWSQQLQNITEIRYANSLLDGVALVLQKIENEIPTGAAAAVAAAAAAMMM